MASDLQSRQRHEREGQWVRQILASWQLKDFYGKIVINVQGGFINHVEEQRTLKPPSEVYRGEDNSKKSS
jgi:hypothetical protein